LAFELLRRAREGEAIPAVNHVLPAELIVRSSCAQFCAGDRSI
jgi:DNA-binding LacI/PurR family transcriptional regulator